MKHISLIVLFIIVSTFSFQAKAGNYYSVKTLETVDGETFTSKDVKKVTMRAVGFTGVEVDFVELKTDRIILQNEIQKVEVIAIPMGGFGQQGPGSMIGLPNIDLSFEIRIGGSNTGG